MSRQARGQRARSEMGVQESVIENGRRASRKGTQGVMRSKRWETGWAVQDKEEPGDEKREDEGVLVLV
jgi:hypothetical protein